jgi:O-antigen/teichoic acid export membrane protein
VGVRLPWNPGHLLGEMIRGDSRAGRVARGTFAGLAARLIAAASSLLTVPLLLGYLGLEGYGLWVTAAALTAWVGLGGLGIGPSLLSKLAATPRTEQMAWTSTTATAFWLAMAVAVALIVPLFVLDMVGAWPGLLNVESVDASQLARVFAIAMWIGAAVSVPLAIPAMVLRANQEVEKASAADAAGTLARLLVVVLAVHLEASPQWLVASAVLAPAAVAGLVGLRVFGTRVSRPSLSLCESSKARPLLATGVSFLGIALAGLLIASADALIVSHVLGPEVVPVYSVPFALLVLFVGLEMALLDALWPAYADAATKGDRRWIERANRRTTLLLLATSLSFAVVLTTFGGALIEAWAGSEVVPPPSLLLAFACIALVQAVLLPHGRLLTALGHVKENTRLSLAGAALNIPVSIVLASHVGVTGVALGTLVAYLATGGLIVRRSRVAVRGVAAITRVNA